MTPRILILTALAAAPGFALENVDLPPGPTTSRVQGHIFKPAQEKPTPERIASLQLPEGFEIEAFATGLDAPRMMEFSPQGNLYVTRRGDEGEVLLLRDENGDGQAEKPLRVAKIPHVHGIARRGDQLFLAAIRDLYVADIREDDTLSEPRRIFSDLPDAGQHPNRTLRFSPDGTLYLSVGSTCNAAPEANPENATILKLALDGSDRTIFASGLRNTIGFDWHPETNAMFGADHGIDWLGDETQREELNRIEEGKRYGWPFVFEDGEPNPSDNPKETTGMTWQEYAETCEVPVLTFEAHAAPMALVFYDGDAFPEDFRGDAFVSFHGSWNRGEPAGYDVHRIKFNGGEPVEAAAFLSGFLIDDGRAQFGRPCDLAVAPDGSLFLSDDGGGAIYRIRHTGS